MYRVVGMDGQVYGPVDLPTMQRWCAEGRIAPGSTVVDERTGQQMYAQSIAGLSGCFTPQMTNHGQPANPYAGQAPNPYTPDPYANYPRGGYVNPLQPMGVSRKNKTVAIVLALFLGALGVHRFYLGHTSTGVAMLLMCVLGVCGCPIVVVPLIWSLVDVMLIATDSLTDVTGQRLS